MPIIAYLGGTWPDGDEATAPFTPAQGLTVTLYIGTDGSVQLLVRNADGTVKDISNFFIVLYASFLDSGRVATLTDPTNGICTFQFAQYDTLTPPVTPKRYSYQITATDTGTREVLTLIGDFVVAATVGTPTTPTNSYTPSDVVGYGLPGTTGHNGDVLGVVGGVYALVTPSGGDAVSLQGTPISATTPITGEVLAFDGTDWIPTAVAGTGTVTSVAVGTGLSASPSPITSSGTISLANTSVVAGSYTSANITVDAQGRLTAAASGSAGGVSSVSGTVPIASSGGSTPVISINDSGVVAATYGAAATIPVFAVSAKGLITAVTDTAIAISAAAVTSGTLAIARGGTNSGTALSGSSIMVSNGTSVVQGTAGTATTVLHGNASGTPTYAAVSLTADVSGTLPVGSGGTGATSLTAHSLLLGQTASAVTALGAATNGQIPIGSTGADPVLAALTNGGGITATSGAGSITLGSSGGGDVSGNFGAVTVAKIQGNAVVAGAPTDGYLLIGKTNGTWAPTTLTAGSNVTITNADGGITIASSGGASGYATVDSAGTPLTQRATLNFGAEFGAVDNAGQSRTDITIAAGGVTNAMLVTVGVAKGGTGLTTLTAHAPYVGNGTSAPTSLGVGTNGQIIVGSTAADPAWATLGTGTGISITAGAGTLTVNNTGVTSAVAGTNISVSGATGAVTIGITGQIAVANGGTGLATLTAHAVYVGNGTSAPTALAVGATGTVLHGNTGADPSYSAVSLTADVSGVLPVANGGTNLASYAVGDLLYASGATTIAKLADVATGQVLVSGGVTTAPAYSATPTVTTITGSTSVLTPLLDAVAAGAVNIGTTTATSIVLKQNTSLPTGKTLTLGSNIIAGSVTDKLNAAMLAIASQAVGDILYADATTTFARLADVAVGSYLRSGGTTTAPLWSTLTLPNAATTGDVLVATGTNAVGVVAAVSPAGYMLGSNGTGVAPSYQQPGCVADAVAANGGTTINVNVDTTIYTVPTAPANHTIFVCTGVVGRVAQALVAGSGSPTHTMTVGKTAGGTGFLTSQSVTAATGVGTKYGFTLSTLGSEFIALDGYNAYLSAADTVVVRYAIANSGTISTQLITRWTVTGYWI